MGRNRGLKKVQDGEVNGVSCHLVHRIYSHPSHKDRPNTMGGISPLHTDWNAYSSGSELFLAKNIEPYLGEHRPYGCLGQPRHPCIARDSLARQKNELLGYSTLSSAYRFAE